MKELKENAKKLFDKRVEQDHIKEYTKEKLCIGYNGGLFTITPELIVFLDMLPKNKWPIFDMYGTPVLIEDVKKFKAEIKARYFELANEAWQDWQDVDKKYK